MKPMSLWTGTKWIAASAFVVATAVGCGGGDENAAGEGDNGGVSNSIKSPVMDKNDDKATAGGTANTATKSTP